MWPSLYRTLHLWRTDLSIHWIIKIVPSRWIKTWHHVCCRINTWATANEFQQHCSIFLPQQKSNGSDCRNVARQLMKHLNSDCFKTLTHGVCVQPCLAVSCHCVFFKRANKNLQRKCLQFIEFLPISEMINELTCIPMIHDMPRHADRASSHTHLLPPSIHWYSTTACLTLNMLIWLNICLTNIAS